MRLEINFTVPLEYATELIVLGNECFRLQLKSLVLLERPFKMNNFALQQIFVSLDSIIENLVTAYG